ncbi:transmembrane protein 232 [Spea bombifrons]|uniref:transmembrane protein 232 n=1 Tax=Spea bombifrons TaxID=233779 RepID=UPI00234B9C1E|nr:transmembrane protein 232 [Spea bombifrons]
MPIVKVPVMQKFGIISTTYHLELQKRLLAKAAVCEDKSADHKNPLEITDEFIKQFNNAEEPKEQEYLLDMAEKILQRCKRRTGLGSNGYGSHVNLHCAWTELILLAQCKGKIQEDALDILFISMDMATINQEHMPALFFVAESVLYRICTDVAKKPYLFTNEVKLYKLGFLTFLRLYICYLTGELQGFKDQKERLSSYLKALSLCEDTYQAYPYILFSIHVMLKVGETICASSLSPVETLTQFQENKAYLKINSFVWNCLLIWLHVQMSNIKLQEVINNLFSLELGHHQENWLESVVALFILGAAAKLNATCLRALMEFGQHFFTYTEQEQSSCYVSPWPWEVACAYSMVLADICLHGSTSEIQKYAFTGFQDKHMSHKAVIKEASLNELLNLDPPQTSNDGDQITWIFSYCTIYNLIKVCHELQGDVTRDGLLDVIWKALYKHRGTERDARIIDAIKLAESEVNGPTNPFVNTSAKTSSSPSPAFSRNVGNRIARALSQRFLPPAVPNIPVPKKSVQKHHPVKLPERKTHSIEKKARLSLREELLLGGSSCSPRPNFVTRANIALRKVIEDQLEKELKIKMEEEEKMIKKEQQEKKNKEEQHFKEVMKKREEILKKSTKPYELPLIKKDTK